MRQRIVGAIAISCEHGCSSRRAHDSLDLTIQAQYLKLLRDLQRSHNLALDLHHPQPRIVAKMCDQVAVMYAGRMVEAGPVKQIYKRAGAPVHAGAPGVHSPARRQSQAAHRDRRPAAGSVGAPVGLRVHPRCPKILDRCRSERRRVRRRDAQTSRCWLSAAATAFGSRDEVRD